MQFPFQGYEVVLSSFSGGGTQNAYVATYRCLVVAHPNTFNQGDALFCDNAGSINSYLIAPTSESLPTGSSPSNNKTIGAMVLESGERLRHFSTSGASSVTIHVFRLPEI